MREMWPFGLEEDEEDCAYFYPVDLDQAQVAFDGTFVAHGPGGESVPGDPDVSIRHLFMRVNEVFKGSIREGDVVVVEVTTLRGSRSAAQLWPLISGWRALVATDEIMALPACGFTRPFDEATADAWRRELRDPPAE